MTWTIYITIEHPQNGDPEFTRCCDWKAESDNGALLYGYDFTSDEAAREDARSAIRAYSR